MLGLSYSVSRSTPLLGLVLLLLTLVLTHVLPAQTRSARRAIRHTDLATRSFGMQSVPDPLLASFSRRELAPLSELRPSEAPSTAVMATPSFHQPVNLNLLLAPTTEKWSTSASACTSPRDLIVPSAFAEPSERSSDEAANRLAEHLNDPKFYAHHIPGAGPIVDRVLKESKAHPRLTRVLEFIQPQF